MTVNSTNNNRPSRVDPARQPQPAQQDPRSAPTSAPSSSPAQAPASGPDVDPQTRREARLHAYRREAEDRLRFDPRFAQQPAGFGAGPNGAAPGPNGAPAGPRRGIGGPQGFPGAGPGRQPTPAEQHALSQATEQVYQAVFAAQRAVGHALEQGTPEDIGAAYRQLQDAHAFALQHKMRAEQQFGPNSAAATHAGDPLGHVEHTLDQNEALSHFAAANADHPGEARQGTLQLARMAATDPADPGSQARHNVARKLWNRTKAQLAVSGDPDLKAAVEEAQAGERANASQARAAYDRALFSDDPAERQQALKTLREKGKLSRSRQIESAEVQVAIRDLRGGHLSPQGFAERLDELKAQGNGSAEQLAEQLGPAFAAELQRGDDRARQQLESLTRWNEANLQRDRVDLVLEDLTSRSSAADLQRAEQRLTGEAQAGNDDAQEALTRVSAQRSLADLREAETPEDRARAARDLAAQAEGGNELARLALSAGLLSGQGDAVGDAFGGGGHGAGVVLEGRTRPGPGRGAVPGGTSTGRTGGSTTSGSARGPGPVELGRLGGSIGLPDLPPEATRALQLEAAKHLAKAPGDISRGEALALAAACAQAHADGDRELADAGRKALDAAIDAKSTSALRGVGAAIDAGVPGAESLVPTFTGGTEVPGYGTELRSLSSAAVAGNRAAIDVHAHAASSDDARLHREGARTLKTASAAGHTEAATDALLDVDEGARGPAYHRTLGEAAAEGELDAARDGKVRDALRQGLSSPEDAPQHASAAEGMAAVADRWTETDAQAIAEHLSSAVVESLVDASARLSPEQAGPVKAALTEELAGDDDAAAGLAAKALGSLGRHADVSDVEALTDRLAGSGERRGLEGLINLMSRTDDPRVGEAATRAVMDNQWSGLDELDDKAKQQLVDYVQGSGDPVLQTEIADLVYGANIRPPVSGLLPKWGVEGTPDELRAKALRAQSHYGDEAVRELKAEVELYNALPPDLRAELVGQEGATDAERAAMVQDIDLDRAVDLAAEGKLHTSRHAFLLDGLQDKARDLSLAQHRESAALKQRQKALSLRREQALESLTRLTGEGVSFGDRAEHAWSYANPVGWFAGRSESDVDRFERRQGSGVDELRAAEQALDANSRRIAQAARRQLFLDAARDTGDSERFRAEGRARAADSTALDAWREHGEMLGELSPGLHKELFQEGDTPQTEGAWQRLQRNGVVGLEEPPSLAGTPDERYQKAADSLRDLAETKSERWAVRNQALFALDQDPDVQKLTAAGAQLAQGLPAVQKMLSAGMEGTKYEDYVDDLQRRAGPLRDTLRELKNDPGVIAGAKERLGQLRELEADLRDSGDPTALREVRDRIEGIQGMVDLVENDALRHTLDTVLDKSKTNPDTFASWMEHEGPKVAAAIGVGVTAAVTVVATGGAAAPLWAVALAGAAGGMVGYEAAAEGMHHLRNGYDDDVTSGRLAYGDRSRAGSYFGGEEVFDPETGRFRDQTFLGDAAGPYATQLATDFALTYATMGVGRAFASGINKVGAGFFTRNASTIRRVGSHVGQIEKQLGKEAARRTLRQVGKDVAKRFPGEFADEVKDTAAEMALQQGLQRIDKRLSTVAGVLVATGKGINIRSGADGNLQYDGQGEARLRGLLEADGVDLRPVNGKPGHYDVLIEGGDSLRLSPVAGTVDEAGPRRADGSLAPDPPPSDKPRRMDTDPKILGQRAEARRRLAGKLEADLADDDVSEEAAFARQEVMDLRTEAISLDRRAAEIDPGRRGSAPDTATIEEQARARQLVDGLPLADQHAHEIGSTPDQRVGRDFEKIAELDPAAQKRFVDGLHAEIDGVTRGNKPFVVNSLSAAPDGALRAQAEVVASPRGQDAARARVDDVYDGLGGLLGPMDGARRQTRVEAVEQKIAAAEAEVRRLPAEEQQAFTEALSQAKAQLQSDPDLARRSLAGLRQGVLNQMADSAEKLADPSTDERARGREEIRMQRSVLRLRNAARLVKPDSDTWKQLDGDINGGKEFFTRYKSVLGTHGGKMDGAGIAEVAHERRSAMAGELGYQEVRADLDTDRFQKRFGERQDGGLLSMDQLAERSRTFADVTGQTDAHMVYALTKRETATPEGGDPTEAGEEAPAYARQAETFVDAYFEKGPDGRLTERARDLQSGIAGLDHGGRESAERAPMLFAKAHGKRNVHNALELQGAVERARQGDTAARAEIDELIAEQVGDPALLAKWKELSGDQLDPSSWSVRAGDAQIDSDDPKFQAKLAEQGRRAPGDWQVDVGDMSVEEIARVNRAVHSALRTHASGQGRSADVDLLGATNHSGEQLQSVPPDVLLDQVDQSLAMGVDRIGHGVILGTPMSTVYEAGPGGKLWPKNVKASKRTADNEHLANTPAEVEALEARRKDLIQRAKDGDVVIEVNLTSNLVINDQATTEHAIHEFHQHGKDGLRFTVNTDDETILDTSTRGEYRKVQAAAELDATETARVLLEGYDSRLGAKPLAQRQPLIDEFSQHMERNLFTGDEGADAARVERLADHFGVPFDSGATPAQNLKAVIAKVMS